MSAVLGILNKQAIAIAADSAVTIDGDNGKKIFNTANKVFALSKFHPVGVMLYNSDSFMSCPWETIIKIYRKQLGKTHFGTVEQYQEDFIEFIKSKNYFSSESDQDFHLSLFAQNIISMVINELMESHQALLDTLNLGDGSEEAIIALGENKIKILDLVYSIVDNHIGIIGINPNNCDDFLDYTYDNFSESKSALIIPLINNAIIGDGSVFNDDDINKDFKDKLISLIYICLKRKDFLGNFTGLVFTGFGENEIYPSLVPINISFAVGERLRFYIDDNNAAHITNENRATIRPFAQKDVIDTILSGIDPKLNDMYIQNFGSVLT